MICLDDSNYFGFVDLESFALLWYSDEPVQEDRSEYVEDYKDPKDPEIPPSISIMNSESREKAIGVVKRTKRASIHGIGISKISTCVAYV